MSFVQSILRALASLPRFVYRTVLRAGRFVVEMFSVPAEPLPAISPAVAQEAKGASATDAAIAALRRVGGAIIQGQVPKGEDLGAVPEKAVLWMRSMQRPELARLLTAQDEAIRAHMRGITPIRGIVPYETEAITAVTEARKAEPKRRTLRDLLPDIEAAREPAPGM
jgi:hypothetical protein